MLWTLLVQLACTAWVIIFERGKLSRCGSRPRRIAVFTSISLALLFRTAKALRVNPWPLPRRARKHT